MLKLIDKALLGRVSESPGRNENEHIGSLVIRNPKAEPFGVWRKQHRTVETWLIPPFYFGGVLVAAWWQGIPKQLEKPCLPHRMWSKVNSITERERNGQAAR